MELKLGSWSLFYVITVLISIGTGFMLLVWGFPTAILWTARCSVVLFLAVFAASALSTLFPGPWHHWLLQNRRYLGLDMGYSHLVHLLAILCNAYLNLGPAPDPIGQDLGGAITYGILLLMMATSFPSTERLLPFHLWKALHKGGIYLLWISFVIAYMPTPNENTLWLPLVLLLIAFLLRILAVIKNRM